MVQKDECAVGIKYSNFDSRSDVHLFVDLAMLPRRHLQIYFVLDYLPQCLNKISKVFAHLLYWYKYYLYDMAA